MNKIAHGLVLVFFGIACRFIAGYLRLSGALRFHLDGHQLPAYTRLCQGLGPGVLTAAVAAAAAYCLMVWIRKEDRRPPWVAFLAVTTATTVLAFLLAVAAVQLPVLDVLNRMPPAKF